jgi:arylsulfatase A-like enzyme
MQGLPFTDILRRGTADRPRTSVYYHYYEYPAVHMVKRHYGIRTKRYKLIRYYYDIDAWELFDLERDPRELRNVIDDPAYASVLRELRAELGRRQAAYGDSEDLARAFLKKDLEEQRKK